VHYAAIRCFPFVSRMSANLNFIKDSTRVPPSNTITIPIHKWQDLQSSPNGEHVLRSLINSYWSLIIRSIAAALVRAGSNPAATRFSHGRSPGRKLNRITSVSNRVWIYNSKVRWCPAKDAFAREISRDRSLNTLIIRNNSQFHSYYSRNENVGSLSLSPSSLSLS